MLLIFKTSNEKTHFRNHKWIFKTETKLAALFMEITHHCIPEQIWWECYLRTIKKKSRFEMCLYTNWLEIPHFPG